MPRVPLVTGDPLADYAAFSDESHSDGDNSFMVIGGILCRSADAHFVSKRFNEIHERSRYREPIEFKTTSKRKLGLYEEILDEFFALNRSRIVDFSCIVFEHSRVNHRRYSPQNPDAGFFKFLYQHHAAHARRYKPTSTFRVFHGNMETRYDLNELKRCLNAGAPKRGLTLFAPYAQVEFLRVSETKCLQVADLLIGTVGCILNGKHAGKPDSPKAQISRYVELNAPITSLANPTCWPDWGFNIWHFEL